MLPGLKKRVVNLHDVIMYVAIARKHLRLMALLLCFCWLGAVVFYVYSKPVYFSRSLVKTDMIDRAKTAEDRFNERSRVQGIANEMVLPHIIERAAKRLGVEAGVKDIQAHYVKKVKAVRNSEGNIEIEAYPYSFDWANRWSATMVREYLDYRYQSRRTEMEQRTQSYEADRKDLLALIDKDRREIAEKRVDSDLARAYTNYDILASTPRDLGDTKRKLSAIHNAKAQLSSPDLDTVGRLSLISAVTDEIQVGTLIQPSGPAANPNAPVLIAPEPQIPPPSAPGAPNSSPAIQSAPLGNSGKSEPLVVITPQTSSDSGWRQIVRDINILNAQRTDLLRKYQPGHKDVVAIQDRLDGLDTVLTAELTGSLERLKISDRELTQRLAELEKKLPLLEKAEHDLKKARDDQGLVGSTMARWLNLVRIIDQKYEQDLFSFDRDKVKITYFGITAINENPVSPNRFGLLLYATVFGLVLAIGVPFLIEYLDHTLSNLEEVEATFQLRGLGIIPKLSTDDEQTTLMDRHASKETNLVENFRVIRTNLLSMGSVTKAPHVVIVTSAMPKEGKTFVSTNLALSFAQTGAKTLIIDTDLRRGRLHRLFGYRKQPGLSGVLLDQITLDEAIRPTPSENLFMISAGQHLETGTELLGSKKFIDILAALRQKFDRIVMDTPPVLGLSETSILQNHVDGVLFVIWSGQTPIKSVKAAIEILQANGANFYGFVLNRLDLNATANYYQYYYYSHDYYYQYSPRTLENNK